ncbi:TIGR03546 family protein [Candidatus Omnitrophota bacterium]
MIPFVNLPVKIVRLFTSNVSPSEVAAGVCLGMFMGFVPLNGPMAIVLLVCLFVFKINRLAAMLVLPFFKLLYVLGISSLTDAAGGLLLINAGFLAPVWRILTHIPILALLDLNNTLVAGGLALSAALCFPVYVLSKKGIVVLREKYFDKIKNSKIVKWFLKIPIIGKLMTLSGRLKGGE